MVAEIFSPSLVPNLPRFGCSKERRNDEQPAPGENRAAVGRRSSLLWTVVGSLVRDRR